MCIEPAPTHYPAPFGIYPPIGGTDQPIGCLSTPGGVHRRFGSYEIILTG